jgi:amino acid transporter
MPNQSHNQANADKHNLARRLGLFDATMIVMGGIIGAGIFTNPYVVAQQVHTPLLILGAWPSAASSRWRAHSSMQNFHHR